MATTNGYPTGATPTTTVPAAASVAGSASVLSAYLFDNSEIDVTKVFRARNSFFNVLTNLGRSNGGSYDSLGTFEKLSNNYPEYRWQNKGEDGYQFTMNAAALVGDTTLTLVSTVGLFAGRRLQNVATNEVVTVKSITSATQIVVVRGAVPVAMGATDTLLSVGTAVGVGVASTTFVGAANSSKSNFFQHFVTTITVTDKDMLASKVGGDKRAQIEDVLADKMTTHADEIERGVLFGQKQTFTDATLGEVYTMDGIKEFAIQGWTADISSGLTAQSLEDALAFPLRYAKDGSTTKILLCGSKVKSRISSLFYSGQVRTENIKEIDLTVEKVITNGGEYILMQHPFMDESSGNWSKCALVIDPGYVEVVYPQGVDLEKKGFNGKTAMIYNAANSNYASEQVDISTYLTIAVKNVNACGALRVAA
jgi:hypothetical protein